MNKTLVTGAGGFLGRALTKRLASLGHSVIAADNNFRGNLNTLGSHPNIQPAECNVLDFARVQELCRGVNQVFHLAAINGTENFYKLPEAVLEVGVIGTHNVAKAVKAAGVQRLIFASSSEIYNDPPVVPTPEEVTAKVPDVLNARFSYGGGKLAGELITVNYLRNSSTDFTIFRPHNVYGPQMGFEHVIPQFVGKIFAESQKQPGQKDLKITIQGDGSETRSFIFIDDAVEAITLCSAPGLPSGIFHLGTQDEISIRDLLLRTGEMLGFRIHPETTALTQGSPKRRCPNTDKLKKLGFSPRFSLNAGLEETVRWYWAHYQKQ